MSKTNFSEDFKRDAVRQITDKGYPVEVSQRLGVSTQLKAQCITVFTDLCSFL